MRELTRPAPAASHGASGRAPRAGESTTQPTLSASSEPPDTLVSVTGSRRSVGLTTPATRTSASYKQLNSRGGKRDATVSTSPSRRSRCNADSHRQSAARSVCLHFFAITIASIAFSIAASGRPSRELTTAMCAALAAWQMAGYSRSCARTTSRLWPRALEWTGIACAIISIGAAVTSVITSNGGGYDYFSIPSRVANGALLGTLCCLIALLVLKYRTRDIHA